MCGRREPTRGPVRPGATPLLFVWMCCALFTGVLSSCGASSSLQQDAQRGEETVLAGPYSIVCVIHGDGEYLYHDADDNEYQADEEALSDAIRIAERNPEAEMFIFHQKPRRRLLFLFPLPDGEFYHYRNGRLLAQETYWRDGAEGRFDPEVGLYRRFRAEAKGEKVGLFLYYGHEIPERGGSGYDASSPERTFTVHDLVRGLSGFTRETGAFELLLLSTCFGGTPYTIGALGPFARHIVASPDNLHLSYFDLAALEHLERSVQEGDVRSLASRCAREAFERLTREIQTAVSVAVYDVDRVQEFIRSVYSVYDSTLSSVKGDTPASMARIERCDCAELPAYALPTIQAGVEVFYRPARFGRSKSKKNHSGWECWRERESQAQHPRPSDPF